MRSSHVYPASTPPAAAPEVASSLSPSIARLKLRCRRCGHFRNPDEFVLGHVIGYCLHCYERHRQALDVLQGSIPTGCAECGTSFASLQALAAPADARMFLHYIAGIYALLCPGCSDSYELKRRDLYGATPYGAGKFPRT